MPLNNAVQPEIIEVSDHIRLTKYDGTYEKAVEGYRDPRVYQNSEGIFDEDKIPDAEYVRGMLEYLNGVGEVYFIEVLEDGIWRAVGDVTVKNVNPPIALWYEKYRGCGIGTAVMKAVIHRLRTLGCDRITGSTVYKWNTVSQKMHENLGFRKTGENEDEYFYELIL